jgi:ligand-binding sensor domain-containing protein
VAAALAIGLPLAAQSRVWTERERVIVSDFTEVRALAASDARVYVATATGLGLYDRRFRRWEPPVVVADGYPTEPVIAAFADPADDAVWLGTATAALLYRPILRRFERFPLPGGAREFFYDRDDPFRGMYVLTVGGWEFLPRGGFATMREPLPPAGRRVRSLTLESVMARQPVVDAMRAGVLVDERLRTMRYTAAAIVPGTDEYYLGTDRGGVVRFDALMARFEPLPFGLLGQGVGAVVAVPGGVWVGTDARTQRTGLTFVGEDLQEYRYEEGPPGTAFGGRAVRALLPRGREIWAATDRGIVRVTPNGETRRLTTADGLPDDETYALAQGPSGVWIGTAFGLGFFAADGDAVRAADRTAVPVLALSAARDTVWVGTTGGLGMATPGSELFLAPGVDTLLELRSAIVAVTLVADTVVAASVDHLFWRPPGGAWRVVSAVVSQLGSVHALLPDAGGVWVGGRDGLLRYGFAASDVRLFRAPGDVPGAVLGLAADQRYLWVATEAGLVRFDRSAIAP